MTTYFLISSKNFQTFQHAVTINKELEQKALASIQSLVAYICSINLSFGSSLTYSYFLFGSFFLLMFVLI